VSPLGAGVAYLGLTPQASQISPFQGERFRSEVPPAEAPAVPGGPEGQRPQPLRGISTRDFLLDLRPIVP
jgi:hypothetical protein